MLGKLIGKAVAEVVMAPFQAADEAIKVLTEECTCLKHKWDPDCPRHGR